jgi:hypothetical protein
VPITSPTLARLSFAILVPDPCRELRCHCLGRTNWCRCEFSHPITVCKVRWRFRRVISRSTRMRLQTGGLVPTSVTLIAYTSIEQPSRAKSLSFVYVHLGQEVGIRTDLFQFVFAQAPQILLSEAPLVEQCPEHKPQL